VQRDRPVDPRVIDQGLAAPLCGVAGQNKSLQQARRKVDRGNAKIRDRPERCRRLRGSRPGASEGTYPHSEMVIPLAQETRRSSQIASLPLTSFEKSCCGRSRSPTTSIHSSRSADAYLSAVRQQLPCGACPEADIPNWALIATADRFTLPTFIQRTQLPMGIEVD
jgi:hypothetical protein